MNDDLSLPVPVPGGSLPVPSLPPDALVEIAALALRQKRANGPVMRVMNAVGGKIETRLSRLPATVKRLVESGTAEILEGAYWAAGRVGAHPAVPETGEWGHRVAAATGGVLGGFGGIGTALVELPATVAVFFGAMQKVAGEYGFDPAAAEVRLVCLEIFGAGGPLADDDGVDTSFLGTRLAVNGATLQAMVQQVAPALAAVLGRKLASQAVPILGSAAGAGVNLAFLAYYRDMAHVRFGLRRLAGRHGIDAVEVEFRQSLIRLRTGD